MAMRPADGEPTRDGTAETEAHGVQRARQEQRQERERQLKREPYEERRLDHEVVRDRAGRDQPLEVLLDREAERGQKREEPDRRARRWTAAHALADAEQKPGKDEGESPEDDRRGVSEPGVPVLGVKAHVSLRRGRDEPVRDTVRAEPGRHHKWQRDDPGGPPFPHDRHIIPLAGPEDRDAGRRLDR